MRVSEKQLRKIIREEIERFLDQCELNEAELAPASGQKKLPPQNVQGRGADAEKLAAAFEQIKTYIQDKWAPAAKSLGARVGDRNIITFAEKLAAALEQAPVIRQAA